jgi:hypothetical protein
MPLMALNDVDDDVGTVTTDDMRVVQCNIIIALYNNIQGS